MCSACTLYSTYAARYPVPPGYVRGCIINGPLAAIFSPTLALSVLSARAGVGRASVTTVRRRATQVPATSAIWLMAKALQGTTGSASAVSELWNCIVLAPYCYGTCTAQLLLRSWYWMDGLMSMMERSVVDMT